MFTCLPLPTYQEIAVVLKTDHLYAQTEAIVEIFTIIHETASPTRVNEVNMSLIPSVEIWRPHSMQLAEFGLVCWDELNVRGAANPQEGDVNLGEELQYHLDAASNDTEEDMGIPDWMTSDTLTHRAHQSFLLRMDEAYYRQFFPDTPTDLDMMWPGMGPIR